MFVSLRMLTLPADRADERDAIVAAIAEAAPRLPGFVSNYVAPVYPTATINAGHVVWRMVQKTENDAQAARLDPAWRDVIGPAIDGLTLTGVGYRLTRCTPGRASAGIWRGLLFSCFPHADPALVRELEERTQLLPKYVPEIRGWALNRAAWVEGTKTIEYVWEQEYDDVAGLTGPYMDTPIHWGIVDAYFDADCPEYIVDPQLIQVVGAIDRTILE